MRTHRTLRVGDHLWVQNSSGETRELTGLLARRQVTQDFIDSGDFAHHPEDVHVLGRAVLPDGRSVYRLRVTPPKGESYVVGIDTTTWLVDEETFIDHDSPFSLIYGDYHVVDGYLVPFTEVDSNGDHAYDVTAHVQHVIVDKPIDPRIFAALRPVTVETAKPVTTAIEEADRLFFADVTIAGKHFNFLIDSGSQADVIDPRVALALGLKPQGAVEVTGAARTASEGVVALPDLSVGGVAFPAHVATVLGLGNVLGGAAPLDGVLGYPFFAAAELRIDPTRSTMTIAEPGALPVDGERIAVDTDRELPEIHASVNGQDARVVVDTGDTQELLLFKHFLDTHQGIITYAGNRAVLNRGIGGSTNSVGVIVSDLALGSVHLYNRYTNVILASSGAFADRNDGGNVGLGTLKNFVVTFDLANKAIYLQKAQGFDDGRFRSVYDGNL